MDKKDDIIIYQPNNSMQLEVVVGNETVWLTQAQIADLFSVKIPAISKHLRNIFHSGELKENSVVSILENTAGDGKVYQTKFYCLDAILSVGYRVNSINATLFRQWANTVLKDYIIKGYAISQRFERIEQRVYDTEKKIDFFVQKALPPIEGILFDGQIFDAYNFAIDLIKSAKMTIILIDNFVDETVLTMLSKRSTNVKATIYTKYVNDALGLDLRRHNAQYPSINVKIFAKSHDRFLIIDETVYHIGASLKDLGKRWFAFSKMEISATDILERLV
jgi:hypothetical protein